jgi:hypothetical protein
MIWSFILANLRTDTKQFFFEIVAGPLRRDAFKFWLTIFKKIAGFFSITL